MSNATITLIGLFLTTYALKAAAPLVLGGDRQAPLIIERLAVLLPAPLLAALVVSSSVVADGRWALDARLVGVLAAALALWRNLPFVAVVIIAAAATAIARLLT